MDYTNKTLNELLSYEVSQIDDFDIREFVKKTLDTVDPIHRIKPASSTGKYHPKYASGEGGLIRHIKVTVRNVIELIRATPAVESEKDELIAAAILHDMWKYPEGRDHEFTAFDHPALGGQWCKDHGFDTIGRLIAAHQGIWTTSRQMPRFENEQPRKFDEWLLHYSDLMASRAYLACDFDEQGDVVLDPWATRNEDAPKRTIKD
ncbi:MAG: HD domain-containing protein [Bacteroidales bacterium]|nr:HD domain-containing protein [Bacteroidales bacterium]